MTSQNSSLPVRRLSERLTGDASRTITRFFWVGDEQRAQRVINCILDMGDTEAAALLDTTLAEFGDRHPGLRDVLMEHYEEVARRTNASIHPDTDRRLLIGAYFTMDTRTNRRRCSIRRWCPPTIRKASTVGPCVF